MLASLRPLCFVLMSGLLASAPAIAQPVDATPPSKPGDNMLYSPRLQNQNNIQEELQTAAPVIRLTEPEPTLLTLSYGESDAALEGAEKAKLQSFVEEYRSRPTRVELRSYAGPKGGTSSPSRRLSLKRVLEVRDFLVSNGISPDRVIVRALGGARDTGDNERIDIVTSNG